VIVHRLDELAAVAHTLVVWKGQRRGLQALSLGGYETRHDAVLDVWNKAISAIAWVHSVPS